MTGFSETHAAQTGMTRQAVLHLLIAEAFMRRAAIVNGPFALKGSLVLRQYLPDPAARIPGDMDWIGTGPLEEATLSDWMLQATALDLDDGVRFRSFAENRFWRMIEYAMDDGFPTVNTDVLAWIDGEALETQVDVTFGLKLDPPPAPLAYRPLAGGTFTVPAACPLELQLAWKLHQSMVRPRFKDLVDILWLLKANPVDTGKIAEALRDECIKDGVPLTRLTWLLDGSLAQQPIYDRPMAEHYQTWREPKQPESSYARYSDNLGTRGEDVAEKIFRQPEDLPASVEDLLSQLSIALRDSGFPPFAVTR